MASLIESLKLSRWVSFVRGSWWSYNQYANFKNFKGCNVSEWFGCEMALGCPDNDEPIIWYHDSIPFLQFDSIYLYVDKKWYHMMTYQHDQGWGLQVLKLKGERPSLDPISREEQSIYRDRSVSEIPTGTILSVTLNKFDSVNIGAVTMQIDDYFINIFAGEVDEKVNGTFVVLPEDESVLIQVNGKRPA